MAAAPTTSQAERDANMPAQTIEVASAVAHERDEEEEGEEIALLLRMIMASGASLGAKSPLDDDIQSTLRQLYDATSPENKALATQSYRWFVSLFRLVPDYGKYWCEVDNPGNADEPFIVARPASQRTLHHVFAGVLIVAGHKISALVPLLAIAFGLNPHFAKLVQERSKQMGQHLDVADAKLCSMGNARVSPEYGVYCLVTAGDEYIIGHAFARSFKKRLDKPKYLSSSKVRPFMDAEDQRHGRADKILFNLDGLEIKGPSLRWFCTALETVGIIAFGWDVALTPKVLLTLWEGLDKLTAGGIKIPPDTERDVTTKDVPGTMSHFVHTYLYGQYIESGRLEVQSFGRLIRQMSVLADTGVHPTFPPLLDGAFVCTRPESRDNADAYYHVGRLTHNYPRHSIGRVRPFNSHLLKALAGDFASGRLANNFRMHIARDTWNPDGRLFDSLVTQHRGPEQGWGHGAGVRARMDAFGGEGVVEDTNEAELTGADDDHAEDSDMDWEEEEQEAQEEEEEQEEEEAEMEADQTDDEEEEEEEYVYELQ